MADLLQTEINIDVITTAVEQKFAADIAITGVAPELSSNLFAPYASEDDGIFRYKEEGTPANDEADKGGLFTFAHKQPAMLEQVLMNLGASVAWTVYIVTSAGDWVVGTDTSQYVVLLPQIIIMPDEKIKVVAAAPGATKKSWIRVYVRSEQARR